MHVRELLVQEFDTIYRVIALNVEGLTHADSLVPAAGGGNTANWILGHVVNVQNAMSEQLEQARFDHPIRDAADAIDWDSLVERFNASREACLAALASLTDDSLAEEMPDPFGRDTTRAGMLGVLAIHQCYHAGQLGMARRGAGHKTAILAPGQTAPL